MKLTRREFIKASVASVATGGLMVSGLSMAQTKAQPKTSAMAVRIAKPAVPAKGAWVASTCQGCT